MSNDKRPDQRFAMIAEEMTTEVKPKVIVDLMPSDPQLMVEGTSIKCSRCGLSAFEPALDRRGNPEGIPSLVCLACPQQNAPWYPIPAGLKLATNRYRCCSCGIQRQVTMGISDVNLECRRCGKLTLHGLQVESTPSRSPALRDAYSWMSFDEPSESRRRQSNDDQSVFTDVVNDRYIPSNYPMFTSLINTMMSILRLEDFNVFEARQRNDNFLNGVKDVRRRTGRTWRGIVELLARHYLAATNPTVWVLGGTERMDAWLRTEVFTIRDRLGNSWPKKVELVPNIRVLIERQLKPPAGVMLYVDHTFYERRTNGSFRGGIEYKP